MAAKLIDFSKAPRIKGSTLIGHVFNKRGDGQFVYIGDYIGTVEFHDVQSYLHKPKGVRWQNSFVLAPRKRRDRK